VDNGSLVVGYGDGVKKTTASKLDVNGSANISGDTTISGVLYCNNSLHLSGTNYINGDRIPTTPVSGNGLGITWNNSLSKGEVDLVSYAGGGVGGFDFYIALADSVTAPKVVASIDGNGSFQQNSDYRLKSDVTNLSEQSEMTTMNLRPVSYTMENKPCLGFIADELQDHFPQLVTGTKDGENYQTVNYIGLIAVLVKDIQAQQKQIESMKQDIDALQKQLINKNE
jgi:hypothetical protein